ncbi:hypothetical protein HanRHA438_Chr06g0279271 [Helianthus annuus]|nr:hypothetical protein HanRHA438_Chr06g0279271 [Helianthus annuus]
MQGNGDNEIGNRDPQDFEIKRLKRRVLDLELQQEIKRLRQRIWHLELQQDTCKTKTESSTIVGDEGGDGEQQLFSRHPHRFYNKRICRRKNPDSMKTGLNLMRKNARLCGRFLTEVLFTLMNK